MGRLAHPLIIARKHHSGAGRGPSAATTSPSSPFDIHPTAGAPLIDASVQLPPPPASALPLTTAQHALPPPAAGSSGHALPVPLSLPSADLATRLPVVPDLPAELGNDPMLSITDMPLAAPASTSQADLTASAGTMLDAQAIQAQVEALIKSTSSSVVANATSGQDANTPQLPLESFLPVSTADTSPTATTTQADALAISVAAPVTAFQATALDQQAAVPGGNTAALAPVSDPAVDAAIATGPSFQNTFAQYQFPQNHDRAFKEAARATSTEASRPRGPAPPSSGTADATNPKQEAVVVNAMTREEEERAADALIADVDAQDAANATTQPPKPEPFSGADLAAAAKAIGIEADADLLGGMSEDQRALAAAIKRLGDEHSEAAQKAIQQAAAAAAAAAAARASQELARAAAKEQGGAAGASSAAGPSTPTSAASPASRSGSGPVKRFPCPKCDKAFARAYNLNTHLSTHDPDPNRSKPFACPYPSCKSEGGRSFSRKHDLQRHVASIHENEAEPGIHGDPEEVVGGDTGGLVSLGLGTPGKKFRCENCGRSFVRRDACNRHQCDGKDSPSARTSKSPSGTPYASSVSPRSSTSQGMMGGPPVTLPPARPLSSTSLYMPSAGSMSRASPVPAKYAAGHRSSSNLSKEVQGIAKQLQARVEAQSPVPQQSHGAHGASQRNVAPLPTGERRNFPLSAISLYASTGTPSMHSSSSSSSSGSKIQIAK